MKPFIILLLLHSCLALTGQNKQLNKGIIKDSLWVGTDQKESYALYIPNSYEPSTLAKVIFIFDPSGSGKRGVEQFVKAAEHYNYLLVCSNNSRNGPYEKNFDIANRLFTKIFADFNIDAQRIYTAGFSGGARLASTIAVLTNSIQGVIACGSGFSTHPNHTPFDSRFSYAAIVGDEDMNLSELYETQKFISKIKISNELFVFEMNHRWPSQDQILEAVEWLELEAIRKGLASKNESFISKYYEKIYQKARKLETLEKLLPALDEYKRIIANFKYYYSLDSIKQRINSIELSKVYISLKKELARIQEEETHLNSLLPEQFKSDLNKKKRRLKWWETEIGKLNSRLEKTASANEKKMLSRQLYKTFAMVLEPVNVPNNYTLEQKIFCYDIGLMIYPKYANLYLRQMENFMLMKEPSKALDLLEELLKTGYDNKNELLNNKAFELLKKEPRFLELTKN